MREATTVFSLSCLSVLLHITCTVGIVLLHASCHITTSQHMTYRPIVTPSTHHQKQQPRQTNRKLIVIKLPFHFLPSYHIFYYLSCLFTIYNSYVDIQIIFVKCWYGGHCLVSVPLVSIGRSWPKPHCHPSLSRFSLHRWVLIDWWWVIA